MPDSGFAGRWVVKRLGTGPPKGRWVAGIAWLRPDAAMSVPAATAIDAGRREPKMNGLSLFTPPP